MHPFSQNWSRNLTYRASAVHVPLSVDELQDLVRRSRRIKPLGSRHSFSAIADTDGEHVSLDGLRRIIGSTEREVTLEAGVRYGDLAVYLAAQGLALHNMASLPHISVGGAVATGTHGSGDKLGNLATAVRSFDLVRGDGELITISRETMGARFEGMVVHLGALGVVVRLTLDVEPAYEMRQDVFDDLPLETALSNFDAITSSGTSVSLFTTWSGPTIDQVWIKRRLPADDLAPSFFGATAADGPRHPLRTMPTENCTEQLGVPGPWHERLPHFRMEFTPSSGDELQSEYLLPRKHATEALASLAELRERIAPLLHVSEIRTMAADALWLSPAYGRPTVGIHFTWKDDFAAVSALLPTIEATLRPFSPRPHWGKLSATPREDLATAYPRLTDFHTLQSDFDPEGKFANDYLRAADLSR